MFVIQLGSRCARWVFFLLCWTGSEAESFAAEDCGSASNSPAPPSIEWQQTYAHSGAPIFDFPVLRHLPDGGHVMVARTTCQAGCHDGSGDSDAYVARFDTRGDKLWENLIGGISNDGLVALAVAPDGGILLAGWSTSNATGNKTSPHRASDDAWVVRLDNGGNVIWDQTYAVAEDQEFSDIAPTVDGGFIAVGSFELNDDDAGYAVRVNARGELVWQQTFPYPGEAWFTRVLAMADGSFVIAGSIEANKAPDGFWLLRLTAAGETAWQKFYGSDDEDCRALLATADGGFLLGGISRSPRGGDKISPHYGNYDYWVVRVDAEGNKLWDGAYGGEGIDVLWEIAPGPNGGFLLGGSSPAGSSGNKQSPGFGDFDYWLVGISATGEKLWDCAYGGNAFDYFWDLEPTSDGGVLLAGSSLSPIGGNKTSPLLTDADIWVLKLNLSREDDTDGDGVPDSNDDCPGSGPDAVVNGRGCSIAQLCPCKGPWRNHWEYVRSVLLQSRSFVRQRLITSSERKRLIREALHSHCGRGQPRSRLQPVR